MKEFWISIQVAFTAIGGWLGWFLGGCDGLLYALLAFVVIDYVTGVMCAVVDRRLSSAIGFRGIFKKVLIFALVGIGLATKMYYKENKLPSQLKSKFNGLWTAAYNRFYMDELYQFITHKIIFQKICKPIAWFDRHIIDGTMNLLADMTTSASFAIRKLQSGSIQSYVLV